MLLSGNGVARIRAIVVDDHPGFLQSVVSFLAADFDVVATARDGRSALDLVRQHKPDLVVLDIQMPKLNGIEVARELAKDSWTPAVVICSVETDPEVVEAARKAGALAYVFKARIQRDLVSAAKSALTHKVFVS